MYKETTNLQQLRFHHGPWYLSGSYLTRKSIYLPCRIGWLRACDQPQTASSWPNGHGSSGNLRSESDTLQSKQRRYQISEKHKGHMEKPWVKFQSCYVEKGTWILGGPNQRLFLDLSVLAYLNLWAYSCFCVHKYMWAQEWPESVLCWLVCQVGCVI